MSIIDQVVRYIRRVHWGRERRRRQMQLERALPRIVVRGEQIRLAQKQHRPCKALIKKQRDAMTDELRMDNAADLCGKLAAADVRARMAVTAHIARMS